MFVTIALSLAGLLYAKQTATTGGEIRHTGIRVNGLNYSNVHQNSEHEKEDD